MQKREAFEALQYAVRDYNEALEELRSNVENLGEVSEPYDFSDADGLDQEFPSTYDIPDTYNLESAIDSLQSAYDDFENATSNFVVTFKVSVEVEAEDEDEAREKAEEVVGADQPLPAGATVDVFEVREAESE